MYRFKGIQLVGGSGFCRPLIYDDSTYDNVKDLKKPTITLFFSSEYLFE